MCCNSKGGLVNCSDVPEPVPPSLCSDALGEMRQGKFLPICKKADVGAKQAMNLQRMKMIGIIAAIIMVMRGFSFSLHSGHWGPTMVP